MSGPGPGDPCHLEERRRLRREEAERRARRRRLISGGLATLVVALAAGVGAWALARESGTGDDRAGAPAATAPSTATAAPSTADAAPAMTQSTGANETTEATAPAVAPAPATTRAAARPVVWVQAGHADPREPGYRDQTGAGSGPFGNEVAFTSRLAAAVAARLRDGGADARVLPGRVDPIGAPGAAFVSLHHDAPGGAAAIAGATAGTSENYYNGEGSGDPSPTPYPDSAPHREATTVSPAVQRASTRLAEAIAARYARVYTSANGAGGAFRGVVTSQANPRLTSYYGFFRTGADARVIVEAGAAGADDALLAKTDLLANAIADGIEDDLTARGLIERE